MAKHCHSFMRGMLVKQLISLEDLSPCNGLETRIYTCLRVQPMGLAPV